jgi:hypothetical protein
MKKNIFIWPVIIIFILLIANISRTYSEFGEPVYFGYVINGLAIVIGILIAASFYSGEFQVQVNKMLLALSILLGIISLIQTRTWVMQFGIPDDMFRKTLMNPQAMIITNIIAGILFVRSLFASKIK